MKKIINLKEEFSPHPFGRYPSDGEYNGQVFREKFILPNLKEYGEVVIEFNDVLCGSSFMEETFGGIVRRGYYDKEELFKKLSITHQLDSYLEDFKRKIEKADFGIDKDKELEE